MKLVPRKQINPDDNIGRGMDLALVTLLFLGIGYGLDRAFDTKPAFMIGCFAFAMVGQILRMWFTYDARMRRLDEERVAATQAAPRTTLANSATPARSPAIPPGGTLS